MSDLNKLLQIFQKNKIDFVLIGGYAAVVYGSSQVTRDIDLCVDLRPEVINRLRTALAPVHPVVRGHPKRLSFLEHPTAVENVENLYLQTDLGAVDLLSEVAGVGDFEAAKRHSKELSLFGHPCKILTLEALIRSKEALGREKDLLVAKELKACAEEG